MTERRKEITVLLESGSYEFTGKSWTDITGYVNINDTDGTVIAQFRQGDVVGVFFSGRETEDSTRIDELQKMHDSIASLAQQLAKLEVKVEVYWTNFSIPAAKILHQ